jgi:hypothetical protein
VSGTVLLRELRAPIRGRSADHRGKTRRAEVESAVISIGLPDMPSDRCASWLGLIENGEAVGEIACSGGSYNVTAATIFTPIALTR